MKQLNSLFLPLYRAKSEQLSNPWTKDSLSSVAEHNTRVGEYLKEEKFSYSERLLISFCTIWHGPYLFSNGFVLVFGKLYCEFSNYEAEIPFFTMLYVIVFKNGCELLC